MSGRDSRQSDGILLPFLLTTDESEEANLLVDLLVNRAAPAIEGIIRSSIGQSEESISGSRARETQDVEDIVSEVNVRIMDRLRRLKDPMDGDAIGDFMSYVTVVAHNACHAYLRLRYPNRARLKNKLYYALTHCADLAAWEGSGGRWICGLPRWREERRQIHGSWINQARMNPDCLVKRQRTESIPALLRAIFTSAQSPLALDDLVTLIAEILKISDDQPSMAETLRFNPGGLAAEHIDPVDSAAQRLLLEHVWKEILQLQVSQRAALLLSARDGGRTSVTVFFSEIGIASMREIAQAIGMTADEFAGAEPDLPLDDNAISKRLGISRQQVISCRLSARRRLLRRVKSVG